MSEKAEDFKALQGEMRKMEENEAQLKEELSDVRRWKTGLNIFNLEVIMMKPTFLSLLVDEKKHGFYTERA